MPLFITANDDNRHQLIPSARSMIFCCCSPSGAAFRRGK
ncbi:hypothetical protein ACZ87_02549 [Candidatus Erwinia dacicola]|uniref:Uncharacterized protein n=1 Tax=Candidatus Erwinia dacicola TaxID=252393 RepID=A0A328TS77_9GAMM|nr:hypothetical protein ACZ87_02549 [Candidatus Erwinia dacicola]